MKPGRLSLVMTQALLACGIAQAAGFGDITLHSRIGERLRAEVPIILAPNETADPRCFSLAPLPGADLPVIADARLSIGRKGNGYALFIDGNQTINEPLLQIGVRATCNGNQQREYVLMPEAHPGRSDTATSMAASTLPMAGNLPPTDNGFAVRPQRPQPSVAPLPVARPATRSVAKPVTKPQTKPAQKPPARSVQSQPQKMPPLPKAPPAPSGDRLQIGQAPVALGADQEKREQLGEMEARVLRMESSLSSLREEVDQLHSAVELGAQVAAAKHELRLAQSLESPTLIAPPPQEPPRHSSFGNWLQLLLSALGGGLVSALLAVYLSKRLGRSKPPVR